MLNGMKGARRGPRDCDTSRDSSILWRNHIPASHQTKGTKAPVEGVAPVTSDPGDPELGWVCVTVHRCVYAHLHDVWALELKQHVPQFNITFFYRDDVWGCESESIIRVRNMGESQRLTEQRVFPCFEGVRHNRDQCDTDARPPRAHL